MPVESQASGRGAVRTFAPRERWQRWNFRLLAVFAPALLLAGLAGFLVPSHLALMSGAAPYNVFHLGFGAAGVALVWARRARAIAAFNLAFGAFDLYQAVAGPTGLFPARLFALRPADHVLHAVLGLLLVVVGARGLGLWLGPASSPQELP